MTVTPDSRVRIAPDVVYSDVDGETVLLSGTRGRYYGLDRVGSRIWALLKEEPPLTLVLNRLTAEFDAPPERLWADLARLIDELRQRGLIEVDRPEGP